MNVPTEWILATIGGMGATMAVIVSTGWQFLKSRLEAQDKLISAHQMTISKLQDDVDRLSKGCGMGNCLWKAR